VSLHYIIEIVIVYDYIYSVFLHFTFVFSIMARRLDCNAQFFCYICGKFSTSRNLKSITPLIEQRYNQYFHPVKLGDQNKYFAPHQVCSQCVGGLSYWANKQKRCKYFPFDWPMSWREPKSHDDCYFCSSYTFGTNSKSRKRKLSNVSSVTLTEGDGKRIPDYPLLGELNFF